MIFPLRINHFMILNNIFKTIKDDKLRLARLVLFFPLIDIPILMQMSKQRVFNSFVIAVSM